MLLKCMFMEFNFYSLNKDEYLFSLLYASITIFLPHLHKHL